MLTIPSCYVRIVLLNQTRRKIEMKAEIIKIDMNTFTGTIPFGFDLVEYAHGFDPVNDGCVLYGFDEVGAFFSNPLHCFLKIS
jgi:hypothetical protein|tara:strand:- start:112 stop:360 length:249 start_codon:yes stop_codon:yes gene_type:complete